MTIASPCIRVCVINQTNGLCEGCGRTLSEIAAWGTLDHATRQIVMLQLPERLKAFSAPASRCTVRKGAR